MRAGAASKPAPPAPTSKCFRWFFPHFHGWQHPNHQGQIIDQIPYVLKKWIVRLVAAITLASGALDLYSLMGSPLPGRAQIVFEESPLGFFHLARFVTLLIGFALVISSANLWRRKKRAWQAVVLLTVVAAAIHLARGLDYRELSLSAVLLGLLAATRRSFSVGSGVPNLRWGLVRLGLAVGAALAYGTAGFWLLDTREFGINFHFGGAMLQTLLFLTLQGDPAIVPHTRYARWFLDSLMLTTGVTLAYALFEVFRPVLYRYRTLPLERAMARAIVSRHGRTGLDYFKYWHDRSFFFSETGESFLAYKVGGGHAIVLGDPVGPECEFEELVRGFEMLCRENDWRVAFLQTLPDFLPLYRKLGYRKLKIGDSAFVDLAEFSLECKRYRRLKAKVGQLEMQGVRLVLYETPLPDDALLEAREVSESWLRIPGRRERAFTLGLFEERYLRQTPLYAVLDAKGRMLAFANEIPSYAEGEATLDLMRHRQDSLPGVMDYLFTKVILEKKRLGYRRFGLGMAPMSGFHETEESTLEERAVHHFMQRLNFLFNYQGLRHFKAKFATGWEPRYLVYRNVLTLPRVASAIADVLEIHD